MESAELRFFEAVARTGGMKHAADELHTVQSNVTARVKTLENELGCVLFERHSRGVALTHSGERLLPYARRIAWLLGDAKRAARDEGVLAGPLTIGSLETTPALRLSPLLASYAAMCPEVDIALRPGTTAELIEAVLDRKLEGAFVCGPVAHPSLTERPMFVEELAILAAPGVASIETATQGGIARIAASPSPG
jgi:DNA-binding transcriptional LysR family regulator